MAQKKAHEVDGWLARPDPRVGLVLVYGPDRGLVSERAARFAQSLSLPLDDPFSVVRLDATGEEAGGRLLDEARMVPMFSPRRLIWVRNAGAQKALGDAVAELAATPPPDAVILVEAGDLKKGAALRAAVENGARGMALPCYADESRSVDALIDEALRSAKLTMSAEARDALRGSLGGDRLASRGEIDKLVLFAAGRTEITAEDVRALVGDVSAQSNDAMIDHVLAGEVRAFAGLFARHVQTPQQLYPLLAAILRQLHQLQLLRGRMDSERLSAGVAIAALRPPPFPPRRAALERALARWSGGALSDALGQVQAAVLEGRRRPDLALAITERALLRVASAVSRSAA